MRSTSTLHRCLQSNLNPQPYRPLSEILHIDGSLGEGGGQVLRTALALGSVLGIPTHVYNIRAGRASPGLRPQHLAGAKLVAALTSSKFETPPKIGSTELTLIPSSQEHRKRLEPGGKFGSGTKSSGSISLIIQAALLPAYYRACLHSNQRSSSRSEQTHTQLSLFGGTDVPLSPTMDYMEHGLASVLRQFGVDMALDIRRRGFFPSGGGKVEVGVRRLDSKARSELRPPQEEHYISAHLPPVIENEYENKNKFIFGKNPVEWKPKHESFEDTQLSAIDFRHRHELLSLRHFFFASGGSASFHAQSNIISFDTLLRDFLIKKNHPEYDPRLRELSNVMHCGSVGKKLGPSEASDIACGATVVAYYHRGIALSADHLLSTNPHTVEKRSATYHCANQLLSSVMCDATVDRNMTDMVRFYCNSMNSLCTNETSRGKQQF
mmetsp:Transcript_2387/g.4187  ORF Transcript_2387/g.4187 Transcript_2387/m.4187 type:complete len:437 (-) Transcript_2387:24-1334(-)